MKRTLTSIAAASLVLGTMAPVAFAGTQSYTFVQRHVSVDGHNLSNPWGFVSGGTNYFPIYYLQSAIGSLIPGATATWDGKNLMINVPGFDASKLMGPTVPGTNGIYINGTLVQKFTRIVTNDKGTKTATSFAPIYSLFGVLEQLGLKSTMGADGTWSIAPGLASLSIAGNSNLTLGGSDALTLTGKDSAGNAVAIDQSKVTWSVGNGGVISASGVFAGTASGTYAVTATYMGMTATANVVVAGKAVAFKLSNAATALVADGVSTNTITVSAVDANGNVDTTFNGTATVSDTNLIAAATTAKDQPSDFTAGTGSTGTVQFTNGVATFAVGPTSTQGLSDTITVVGTSAYSTLASSTLTVTSVASALSAVSLAVASGSASSVSANGQYSTQLTVNAVNAAGNSWNGQLGTYVTLTLTGPGSFVAGTTAVTSETVYVPTTGAGTPVSVYSMPGQPGSIVVSAAATGLTSASLTVPSYINTAPGSISVTSTAGTDSKGNAYTLYTVTALDTNGHPMSNSTDAFSVSDNAASTQSGAIVYGTVDSAGVFHSVGTSYGASLQNGVATFAVETTTVGTSPVTLTVSDTTNSFTATAKYSFAAGAATKLAVSPASYYTVKAGQTVTFSAQLEDTNSNPVAQAGQSVTFSFVGTPAGGVQFPTGQSTYTVTTNASGVASVSFIAPSVSALGTIEVQATDSALGTTQYPSTAVAVQPATSTTGYATQVAVINGSTGVAATTATTTIGGAALPTLTATAENAVGGPVAGDVFSVTSSNSNVVSVGTATLTSPSALNGDLTVGMAGNAVITVTDISNPDQPKTTFNISVAPGVAMAESVEYNGSPISTTNTVSVTAGTPVTLQVVNSDTAGNPVPVTGSNALTVDLSSTVGGDFRLSPTGAPVTSVTLQPGQSSVTVYYVNSSAVTLTAGSLVAGKQTTQVTSNLVQTQAYAGAVTAVPATGSVTISGTATAAGSLSVGVTGDLQTVTYASGESAQAVANAIVAAFAGDATYTVTDGNGASSTVTWTQKTATTTGALTATATENGGGAGLGEASNAGTAGTAATAATPTIQTLTVSGATNAGTLTVTVNGTAVSVAVTAGESAAAVATAIYNALNANATITGAYTLGNGSGTVTFTQKTPSATAATVTVVG